MIPGPLLEALGLGLYMVAGITLVAIAFGILHSVFNRAIDAWDLLLPLLVAAMEGRSFLALRQNLDDAGFLEARARIIASRSRVYVLPDRIVIEAQGRAAFLLHADDSDQWQEGGALSTRPRFWDSILVHHPEAVAARRNGEVRHG